MGATVTHLPSLVMYLQVSVVDQVLVLEPREPPVRRTDGHISDNAVQETPVQLEWLKSVYNTLIGKLYILTPRKI